VRLGAGAAALAALRPRAASAAPAGPGAPAPVEVLLADLREASAADFARGQARDVAPVAMGGRAGLRGRAGGVFISGTLILPFPATHAGLHWVIDAADADALDVEVRTSADARAWAPWQPLRIEAVAEDAADREVFAALAGAAGARFAQYRATFRSAEPTTLTAMTLTVINSVDGPQGTATTAAAGPASFPTPEGGSFQVITREGWGCDESLRFRRGSEIWPEMYVPVKKVVLHHTATSNVYTDGAAEVRAIYAYHAKTLRWGDIGYNSLVDKDGKIYEGRHGRGEPSATSPTREILSADVVAGHVYGHNYGSTGVAALGTFDQEPFDLTNMKAAIENVVTFECGRHGIDPTGSSDFLKSDGTWHARLASCSGHSDSYNTECPGTALRDYLPDLARKVYARLNRGTAPTLSPGQDQRAALTAKATLSFTWSADVTAFCLEGWHKPSDSENITYLMGFSRPASGEVGHDDQHWWVQAWSKAEGALPYTSPPLEAGHYTMHVRNAAGARANLTYLVNNPATTPTKPGRK